VRREEKKTKWYPRTGTNLKMRRAFSRGIFVTFCNQYHVYILLRKTGVPVSVACARDALVTVRNVNEAKATLSSVRRCIWRQPLFSSLRRPNCSSTLTTTKFKICGNFCSFQELRQSTTLVCGKYSGRLVGASYNTSIVVNSNSEQHGRTILL
jgi:hypothetical protein